MAQAADEIRQIVEQVLKSSDIAALMGTVDAPSHPASSQQEGGGVFPDVDGAVKAAGAAQRELISLPLETRTRMIAAMRRAVLTGNEWLSRDAVAETGLGNVRDKQVKNALAAEKTPGVEDVGPTAFSDEHGLTLAPVLTKVSCGRLMTARR